MFVKYQHIERFGTQETEGIENGTCYVFPKIDGTNASLWQGTVPDMREVDEESLVLKKTTLVFWPGP